jgi:hypothetical protein
MSKANVDVFAAGGNTAQVTAPDIPTSDGNLGGLITLNPETNKARMCYWILGGFDVNYSSVPTSIPFYLVMPVDGLTDSKRGLLGCIDTTLREDYSIPGGSRTWTDPELGELFRLEWSAFEPVSPPDDKTPA